MGRLVTGVRFATLGPLLIQADGRQVAVAAARERTLLAALALSAGQPVPTARLVDAIWGHHPPRNTRNQLQVCVWRLRTLLAAVSHHPLVDTQPPGYRLAVAPAAVDVAEFRRLRNCAAAAAGCGNHAEAGRLYRAALGCWRATTALADVDSELIRRVTVALGEERLQTVEACLAAELATGRADELVPELIELVGEHPYRERLHGALMLALYQAGRHAEAVAVYRDVRSLFADELGTEPGARLQQLHRAILDRDPALSSGRNRNPLMSRPAMSHTRRPDPPERPQ